MQFSSCFFCLGFFEFLGFLSLQFSSNWENFSHQIFKYFFGTPISFKDMYIRLLRVVPQLIADLFIFFFKFFCSLSHFRNFLLCFFFFQIYYYLLCCVRFCQSNLVYFFILDIVIFFSIGLAQLFKKSPTSLLKMLILSFIFLNIQSTFIIIILMFLSTNSIICIIFQSGPIIYFLSSL